MAFSGGGFMNMGASQFAGDQFALASQGQHDGPDSGGRKQSSKTETVRNVTIRQVLRDNMDSSSDVYTVDGIELQLMTLVGRIIQQTETSACITYTLHDGTGSMGGMLYVNDVKEDELNRTRSDLRVGNYVRVFGVLRLDQEQNISFQSYKTRPVTDFNEITYHNLQVMFQRLHLKQGAPPQGGMVVPAMQAGGMPQAPQGTGMMAAPALAGGSLADQLMALYHSPDVMCLQQGIHINDIMAKLKQSGANYSMDQVKETVEMLVNEAQLYSTVDDDTHRAC
uniref:Replication protein A C-terminal domain-containing protein n=1 Tax=Dunaliella tertiolecta TaxID=3047 RepID=A0A7S3VTV6_DUNTE|mmetsp:Transcript_18426/g.51668  ORF Transcript_18426/g.51668 Transcript_18426/m.51668 type:complete len:281 (+) Transcript_18426:84-926(+)